VVYLALALVVIVLFLVIIALAVMYWYISIPLLITGYILYKWSSNKKKNQQNTSQESSQSKYNSGRRHDQDRTYYEPNFNGYQESYEVGNDYSWSEQRNYGYDQDYNYKKRSYYSRTNSRSNRSSQNREERIRKRLVEFNISPAEAEIIFGKSWRSKLAMYDFRLFYVIKELEIKIKYDPYGRYQKKYASLMNKVLAIIKIVTDENPDLQKDFEENVSDFSDANDNASDYNSKQYYDSNSGQYTYESQQDDIAAAFQILGLKNTASHEEVRNRYKDLILKYHPDRNKSPDATAKTKEIIAAYNLIIQIRRETHWQ